MVERSAFIHTPKKLQTYLDSEKVTVEEYYFN